MNASTGMTRLENIHFNDVEKNADIHNDLQRYQRHLEKSFIGEQIYNEEPAACAC